MSVLLAMTYHLEEISAMVLCMSNGEPVIKVKFKKNATFHIHLSSFIRFHDFFKTDLAKFARNFLLLVWYTYLHTNKYTNKIYITKRKTTHIQSYQNINHLNRNTFENTHNWHLISKLKKCRRSPSKARAWTWWRPQGINLYYQMDIF